MVGNTLGHYEILEPLGSGGMGDVYRAHDTTLNRDVAIKVLHEDVADDPDRLARLKREAHLLAALNHPNVATIHGFEESNGTRFLVMELVKGESLEQRLGRSRPSGRGAVAEGGGGLPVGEALDICRQIAEALEAAHEQGIIHRDLKPANVLITPDGRAKVLDFGLAKTAERATSDTDLSHSPTITIAGTEAGVILGTAPYMSPEQVRGRPLDKRTDIWAFGCVLYETLTGSRAFNRETVADTLAAILEVDPPWDALPGETPATVRALLRRCLHKDPKLRLRDIGDAWVEIEMTLTGPMPIVPDVDAVVTHSPLVRQAFPWAVIGVMLGALFASIVVWSLTRTTALVTYVDLNLANDTFLWGGSSTEARIGGNRPSLPAFGLTPDGRAVVYAATDGNVSQLYRRSLDETGKGVPIAGTEGGWSPLISPDGQEVVFAVSSDAGVDIRVVPIEGGSARTVVAGVGPAGMSWAGDWIAYARQSRGVFRVSATSGNPEQISVRDRETQLYHLYPYLLPGGNAFLYTVLKARFDWRNADIMAQRIGEEPRVLIPNGADARYLPTGHVIFARDGVLWVAGFDPESLEITSPEVRVDDDVMHSVGASNTVIDSGAAQFSFSDSGSLLIARGGVHPEVRTPLVWVRPNGDGKKADPVPGLPPGTVFSLFPRISPDNTRVAYSGPKRVYEREIVVLDLETGGIEQTNLPGKQSEPVWSPDGDRLAFLSEHEGPRNIYIISADDLRNTDPQPITSSNTYKFLSDWSVNDVLLYVQEGQEFLGIWTIDLANDGVPSRLSEWGEWATFSPDGNWVAYCPNENGQWEVYVVPYPAGTPKFKVAQGTGGADPAWSRDGRTLYYRTGKDYREKMMAVDVDLGRSPPVVQGTHRELFSLYMGGAREVRSYDVSVDGRFLMTEAYVHPDQRVTGLVLVQNWFEELNRLSPAGQLP